MRDHLSLPTVLLSGAVALMASVTAFGQNLVTNPGFELPPDTTTNVDNTVTGWNLLLDTSRAQFYNHTPGALPAAQGGGWSLWLKTFEAAGGGATQDVPVVAGQPYTLTAQMLFEPSYPNIPGIDTFLQLQFKDGGTAVGSPDVLHILPTAVTADKTWSPFSITGTAPAGATQVEAEIGWANGSAVPGQQGAFADDVTLTTIPEPASLCLISVCGAALLIRRRNARLA